MKLKNLLSLALSLIFVAIGSMTYAQTVSGVVMDGELDEPLIGANVIIQGTTFGSSTDIDGNFEITSSLPFPWTLEISYTGYSTQSIAVDGPTRDITVSMAADFILGEEIIVSASRRREKIQEAPASVSVLTARKLEASPQENPARNLINLPGVTVQQQSAGRINIQLRGDGGLFGSATFPILDYRSLSGPGLGTFDALNSAINNVDIERIEVVRGPGSALYGPGVTSGVVHFISKSAIDRPGTTVEVIGGELNTFGVSARHATRISEKLGFKINFVHKKGDEFTLDPNDPNDLVQMAKFRTQVTSPGISPDGFIDALLPEKVLLTQSDLDPDGDGNMMQDFWEQNVVNGTLEWRPSNDLSFNLAGGWNEASAVFYNEQGEGLSQANEYWTQLRMQKGGLFAQFFYLSNDGGKEDRPTFLYQTGNSTRIDRKQYEAQLQYNWDMDGFLNSNWTAGSDYRLSKANTYNQVYGRNEADDDFGIFGFYLQTKLALSPKLDFVVAGRYDKFNFLDEGAFQPRAVLVFKASPTHTFRVSYNRAVGAPTQLQTNIDFPLSTVVPGGFDIWLQGNRDARTFNNPVIQLNGALGGAVLPIDYPGLPLLVPFGFSAASVIPGVAGAIATGTGIGPLPANPALAGALGAYLQNPANFPGLQGPTGNWFGINLFTGQELGLIEAPKAALRTEDSWEFGYKGLIANKLGVSLDIYSRKIEGATKFTGISPGYTLLNTQNVGPDLAAAVGNAGLTSFIEQELLNQMFPAPVAAALAAGYTQVVQGGFAAGGAGFVADPGVAALIGGAVVATTPTDQVPDNGVTHLAVGYRTFEAYDYIGSDLGLEYYVSEDLSLFGNYSYISKNVWNPIIQGTDGTEETVISAPKNKFRLGFTYAPLSGFRANMAFQHDPSFEASLGQFSGPTDEKNLIDAGAGYKWDNGLSLDITAQNLFNTEYRYFPNFPKIGRRVLGKLTYSFGGDDRDVSVGDRDNDGIRDQNDQCPDLAGLRKYKGCPKSAEEMAADAARAKAEMEAQMKAEEEARMKAEEEARVKAQAAAAAKAKADAEAQAKAAAARAEAQAKAAADAAAKAAAAAAIEARAAEIEMVTTPIFVRALTDIQFATGSDNLRSSSNSILDEVVSVMQQYDDMRVRIEGHTDSTGGEDTNQRLSEQRATSVMNYLVSKGIDPSRLSSSGYGESSPIADNNTSAGRSQNRRVAFVVIR